MAKKVKTSVWAFLVMALAAMVGLAMTPLATAQQTQNPQQQQQGQQPVTATGCLQKASNGQGYQLTDSSTMKTYDLTAASSDVDLGSHVGHTVTVTGTPSSSSASDQAGAAGANPAANPANPSQPGQPAQPGQPGQPSQPNSQSGQQGQQGQSGQQGGQNQQLQVTNVQMVSNSCQGGGSL